MAERAGLGCHHPQQFQEWETSPEFTAALTEVRLAVEHGVRYFVDELAGEQEAQRVELAARWPDSYDQPATPPAFARFDPERAHWSHTLRGGACPAHGAIPWPLTACTAPACQDARARKAVYRES